VAFAFTEWYMQVYSGHVGFVLGATKLILFFIGMISGIRLVLLKKEIN